MLVYAFTKAAWVYLVAGAMIMLANCWLSCKHRILCFIIPGGGISYHFLGQISLDSNISKSAWVHAWVWCNIPAPFQEWEEEAYPPYANGPGYVISSDIAQYIVSEFDNQILRVSYHNPWPVNIEMSAMFENLTKWMFLPWFSCSRWKTWAWACGSRSSTGLVDRCSIHTTADSTSPVASMATTPRTTSPRSTWSACGENCNLGAPNAATPGDKGLLLAIWNHQQGLGLLWRQRGL